MSSDPAQIADTLEALAAKATGPSWYVQPTQKIGEDLGCAIVADDLGGLVGATLPWPTEIDNEDYGRVEANAALIVTLRNNLPTIIAALKAMEEQTDDECSCDHPNRG
jgi:hypothetical protein